VLNRALAVLLNEIQEPRWLENALKLIHPLLQDSKTDIFIFRDRRTCERALKFCCRLLEDDSDTLGDDQVRSKSVAILIRDIVYANDSDEPLPHTQTQFDLLVDYLIHICEGTDSQVISDTLWVLSWMGGSPSTRDRTHRYIDTIIRSMGQENTHRSALRAACAVRSLVASVGQDDESLRDHVSEALASAALSNAPQTSIDDNPFMDISFFDSFRDMPYLRLLCVLCQDPTWHPQLHHNGHFDNCLAIAKALSSQGHDYIGEYAVPVAHIFATMHASGDVRPLVTEDQVYAIWPLILRAWRYIFDLRVFGGARTARWREPSTMECINAIPSLVEYARKRQGQSEETDHLLVLVEKACRKLDEDEPQHEQDGAQRIRDDPFWQQILPVLRKQISESLDATQRSV
jgi:hypothetical protein